MSTYSSFTRTGEEWLREYQAKHAYWEYRVPAPDSQHEDLHAELASKKHSNRFFNSQLLTLDEELLSDAAHDIVERFIGWLGTGLHAVGGVVGPARGATRLAEFVAFKIGQRRGEPCYWASPKKVGEGAGLRFEFEEGKWWKPTSGLGRPILLVEDVITTGGTTILTEEAVRREGAKVFTAVGCIVNRSGEDKVGFDGNPMTILANINHSAPAWLPAECPLCAQGSKPIKPKPAGDDEGLNWKRLTGQLVKAA